MVAWVSVRSEPRSGGLTFEKPKNPRMARSAKHCRFCVQGLAWTIRDPTATEATMKLLMLFTVAALIVGGIYRTEVSQYFADISNGLSYSPEIGQ